MRRLQLVVTVSLINLAGPSAIVCQEVTSNLTTDPYAAPLVYEDIDTFVRAHALLSERADTLDVLQAEYLDRGTPGLTIFIEKYELTAEMLRDAIREHPEKYASLGDIPPLLAIKESQTRDAFARLQEYIPDAVFPPTYYLVGAHRGIGSGSVEGSLITVEKWVPPLEDKRPLLIHELTHFQQVVAVGYPKYVLLFGPEKTLLGLCIREGTAEFFADLVTGEITQDEALQFTLDNERRLWTALRNEMDGAETGDWMWVKPADPDQPRHVGYVMGYRIVQAYYQNASDKDQAVKEILGVTDYPAFLERSGYEERFAE